MLDDSIPPAPTVGQDATSVALRTVLQIAEVVNQSADERDLIERALDAIVAYTRFPCCGLFRLDASGQWLDMVARRNVSAEVYEKAKRLPLEGSLTGTAIVRREVVTSSDLAQDQRLEPHTREALAKEGYVEVASVPLLHGDTALGAVNFIYTTHGTLGQADREILLGIARTIAIVLANRIAESERKRLEEQVRRNEQIERLGLLAGGIAHDFNNLLTGILGMVSLARHQVGDSPELRSVSTLLEEAEKAARRSAELVRQLLTFSKGGAPLLRTTLGLEGLVRESAAFSAHGSSVRLDYRIAHALPTMEIDSAQISQMVQNLVLNAVQASAGGGSVEVTVEGASAPPGDGRAWVCIRVTDHGSGIAHEHLPRLFEPYFTTKTTGHGLGLATVQSIAQRHGGRVEVSSQAGHGTTFSVYLPGSTKPMAQAQAVETMVRPEVVGGRALLMDDDATIRVLSRALCVAEGYEVETVATGEEAVAACGRAVAAQQPFDVAVLDLTIVGGMGGKEAMSLIRALSPHTAGVVTSGYSDDDVMARYAEHGFDAALEKPFSRQQFTAALQAARAMRVRRATGI